MHQTLLKESFEHYLFFLFNQYIDISVIPFKDKDEKSKQKEKYYTDNFLDDKLNDLERRGQIENLVILEEIFNENYNIDMLKIDEILEKKKIKKII